MTEKIYDVIIIGGGPAGLAAGSYAGRSRMSTLIIEKEKIGGQITGDVVIGAAAEKGQTGEITINGLVFQCVFSASGNLVALKNMGKAKNTTGGVPAKAGSPDAGQSGNAHGSKTTAETGSASESTGGSQNTGNADGAGKTGADVSGIRTFTVNTPEDMEKLCGIE